MAWLLVPLQYLFVVWRAQRYIAKASAAAGTRKHAPYLKKATKAVIAAEILKSRFPMLRIGSKLVAMRKLCASNCGSRIQSLSGLFSERRLPQVEDTHTAVTYGRKLDVRGKSV